MSFLLVGASFREISLEELELLDAQSHEIRGALFSSESTKFGITGCVVVSTCSRFEVYVETDNSESSMQYIAKTIEKISGLRADRLKIRKGSDVVHHLFRVASGLESMIVGEVEVAGQVKRAFLYSQQHKQTCSSIEALFQRSAKVTKKIVNETELGKAGRSFITGGLDILKVRHFAIQGRRALVIGTGAYARVVISALKRENVDGIFVYSYSGRAEEFSSAHGATPVEKNELAYALQKVDFVISCSGTHRNTITTKDVQNLGKELFPIIDLSLTRDIERSVETLPHIMMIDLREIYQSAPAEHFETLTVAEAIITKAAALFIAELEARRSQRNLRHSQTTISLDEEFEKTVGALAGLNSQV